jgi:hypothetical protein
VPSEAAPACEGRSTIGHHRLANPSLPPNTLEQAVKVYQILFLVWFIVFAFWIVRQFSEHNRRRERK